MKRRYTVTVGEVANCIGHISHHECATDAEATRVAKRVAAPSVLYGRDGWWVVEDADGRRVASGGRRSL
jgi:signal transduction histidine kinase